jgi:hypothetical protein
MKFAARFAALLFCLLAVSIAPVRSAEIANPNDTARFLAGLPPSPDSPLAALTKDPTWQSYARRFDQIFGQEDRGHLGKVRAFAKSRLTTPHDTVFYFFSGPDALHAVALFPTASTYVMAGLEPPGNIPPLNSLPRGTALNALGRIASEMNTLLSLSFFITKNMRSQLSSGPVYGTLPVIYVFLARSGKTIHETTFVNLDKDGNEKPPEEAKNSGARGVKIVFSSGDDGPKQTLYYFSTNLANDGVKTSGFLAFCEKLGAADSFVKSASYLLHSGGFSTIRDFMLDHSASILQDDSGIPVKYFDRSKWQFQPFGRYLGPIGIFAQHYQPQMSEVFRRQSSPIDFGLGYRWRVNESNLLLAQKTAASAKPD